MVYSNLTLLPLTERKEPALPFLQIGHIPLLPLQQQLPKKPSIPHFICFPGARNHSKTSKHDPHTHRKQSSTPQRSLRSPCSPPPLSNGKVCIRQNLIKSVRDMRFGSKKKIYRYIMIRYSYIITASQKRG